MQPEDDADSGLENTFDLVDRAKAGRDQPAWSLLFDKLQSRLAMRFRGRKLPPGTEYGDFEGEVVGKILTGLDRYEPQAGATFWSWVHRVAENTINDMWRRQPPRPERGGRKVQSLDDSEGNPIDLSDRDPLTVTGKVRERELREILLACLHEVPAKYAEVLRVRLLEELEHAEIARRLGLRDDAESRLYYHRGMKSLVELMQSRGLGHTTAGPDARDGAARTSD